MLCMMRPHPRQVVRLQLETHGHPIVFCLAHFSSQTVNLVGEAHQLLNVVPHLMCDDIGLCKIAGSIESISQFLIKTQINIKLLISWTIKWPRGSGGKSAGGLYTSCEQHQGRLTIIVEQLVPDKLRIA